MIDEICEWTGKPVDTCEGQCCWPGSSRDLLPGGYLVEPSIPELPEEVQDRSGTPASLFGFPVRVTDENLPAELHIKFGTSSEYDRVDGDSELPDDVPLSII